MSSQINTTAQLGARTTDSRRLLTPERSFEPPVLRTSAPGLRTKLSAYGSPPMNHGHELMGPSPPQTAVGHPRAGRGPPATPSICACRAVGNATPRELQRHASHCTSAPIPGRAKERARSGRGRPDRLGTRQNGFLAKNSAGSTKCRQTLSVEDDPRSPLRHA